MHLFVASITVECVKDIGFSDLPRRRTGLMWGVYGSFRDYIGKLSDGRMQVAGGAELTATGEVFFPVDQTAPRDSELRCVGSVSFTGHRGMLVVQLAEPWLQLSEAHAVLSVIDPFEPTARMSLVTVKLGDSGWGTTQLTEAGTDVFMGNYPEHTHFDPLRIL